MEKDDADKQIATQTEQGFTRKSSIVKSIKRNTSNIGLNLSLKNQASKDVPLIEDGDSTKRFSPLFRQTLTFCGPITATIAAGMVSGYSAVLLPQLESPDSIIIIDDEIKSWIASMAALPMSIGCLLSGWLMERYGRKLYHQAICIPFIIGWLLVAFSNELPTMLAGRFIGGLCVGLIGPLGPVYIAETSSPKYRGFFLAGVSLAIALGLMIIHLIGAYVHWKLTAMISTAFPLVSFVFFFFIPESPSWLISKDRIDEGVKAFFWLRGYEDSSKEELKQIIENHHIHKAETENYTLKEKMGLLKLPEVYKPLFIMIIFFMTAQFSGVNAVAFYSVDIMRKALGESFDKYTAMFIIDAVRLLLSILACILVKHVGRRVLTSVSGFLAAFSLFTLAIYLYLMKTVTLTSLSWIPLVSLITYICAVSIGLVPLPWMMCGELFPTKARGVGSGISSAVTFTAFFVVVKTVPALSNAVGDSGMFLTYGTLSCIGTFVMLFILPETRGKSLQEIEDRFKSKKEVEIKKEVA